MAPSDRLGAARGGGPAPGTTAGRAGSATGSTTPACSTRPWPTGRGVPSSAGRTSNERLEFLGDAVLGLVVAEYTYRTHPELSDGACPRSGPRWSTPGSWPRSASTSGIAEHLRLGRGEDLSGGRAKESILADATEAVIGAVYLDGGLAEAERLVLALLKDRIAVAVGEPGESDHKSRLQELTVRLGRGVPQYEVEGFGPDHARRYLATVYVAGQRLGTGEGRSKKDAEQVAAQVACGSLEVERGGGDA